MTTKQFVRQLECLSNEGYKFALQTGVNLDANNKPQPKYVIRCVAFPGKQLRYGTTPIEAVCHQVTGDLPKHSAAWIAACRLIGLTVAQGSMIARAGDQILGYDNNGKLRIKYSRRLRRDMLAACNLEEA